MSTKRLLLNVGVIFFSVMLLTVWLEISDNGKPVPVGPYELQVWYPNHTVFFSGLLRVESPDRFVVKTVVGEVMQKSHPEQIVGRKGIVNVVEFQATASEYYRIDQVATVYSQFENEIYFFWDPFNQGWLLP